MAVKTLKFSFCHEKWAMGSFQCSWSHEFAGIGEVGLFSVQGGIYFRRSTIYFFGSVAWDLFLV